MPDFKTLSEKEYLITNGMGGYASSSLSGANTRRYHGLLVASFHPPVERMVLVSKLEETVITGDHAFELSANQYQGMIHPQGFHYLQETVYQINAITFSYAGTGWNLEKKIGMVQGQNKTIVTYTNTGEAQLSLIIRPLLVFRDYHSLLRQTDYYDFYVEPLEGQVLKIYAHYGARPFFVRYSHGVWKPEDFWVNRLELEREKERGFDFVEDARCKGCIAVVLDRDESCRIELFIEGETNKQVASQPMLQQRLPVFVEDLLTSSRHFVVHRLSTGGDTLIAGYHWFTDWGRDTMIAIRGISIAAGRQEEARSILQTFLHYVDRGMLPNRFPDGNELPEYNTIDASLWLFVALYEYYKQFGDAGFIRTTLPFLQEILEWHTRGTRYQIRQTREGLLYGGEQGQQLTWMDARVDGYVVTPRIGCPVEINLLWYNAICIYSALTQAVTGEKKLLPDIEVEKTGRAITAYFVNEKGYLNDVVLPGASADDTIRPNQIYALSLPFSPLYARVKSQVLACVETNLYTGLGLRTLDPENAAFRPVYAGNAWQRDTAYHQGTVWPFLWGEWALAYLNVNGFSPATCAAVWNRAAALREHFYNQGCLHGIAEIFDGLEPGEGKGCIQQAWSVAMLLRVFLDKRFDFSQC